MSLPRISAVSSIVPSPPISSPQPFPVVVLQLSTGSFLGVDWCYENGPLGRGPLSMPTHLDNSPNVLTLQAANLLVPTKPLACSSTLTRIFASRVVEWVSGQATCVLCVRVSRTVHFHTFLHELQLSGDYCLLNNIDKSFNSYAQFVLWFCFAVWLLFFRPEPWVDSGLRNGPRSLLTPQCGMLIHALFNSFSNTNTVWRPGESREGGGRKKIKLLCADYLATASSF